MADEIETTFGGAEEDWTPLARVEAPAKLDAPAPPEGEVAEEPAVEPTEGRQRGPDGRFLPLTEAPVVEAPVAAKPDAAEQRWMQYVQAQEERHAQQMQVLMQALQQRQAPAVPPPEPEVRFEDLEPLDQLAYLHQNQHSLAQENAALKQQLAATGQTTTQIRQQTFEAELSRDVPAMIAKFPMLDQDDHAEIIGVWQRADESRSVIQIAAEYAARMEKKGQRWAAAKGLSARPAPAAAVRSGLPTPAAGAPDKFEGIDFDDHTDEGWNDGFKKLQSRTRNR